jgi:protein-S-isoprenylcysteine O-methyltransferase Ste14
MPLSAYLKAGLFVLAAAVIRIQTDRGQHVVTTGLYAFVRHPGYIAGIPIILQPDVIPSRLRGTER